MRKYLSLEEKTELIKRYQSEKKRKAEDCITAVLLDDGGGWSYRRITRALFIYEKMLSLNIKDYQKKRNLKNISDRAESKLNRQQSEEVIADLKQYTYLNRYMIIVCLKEKYRITYSHYGIIVWLYQRDFTYKESTKKPAKNDTEKHDIRLKDSLLENAVILLRDDVHSSLKTKISSSWMIREGVNKPVERMALRVRFNFFDEVNLHDLSVASETYSTMNSKSISNFLGQLNKAYPENKMHLFLDQKSYNKSKEALKKANYLDINMHNLLSYSANLNSIERLWKVMSKKIRNSIFFKSPKYFKKFIAEFFKYTGDQIKHNIFITMNNNFQCFKFGILN